LNALFTVADGFGSTSLFWAPLDQAKTWKSID
jgi:hypothetical protein